VALSFEDQTNDMNPIARISRLSLLASVFAATLQDPVKADLININGSLYNVQTLKGSFESNSSLLKSQPWYGSESLARDLAYSWPKLEQVFFAYSYNPSAYSGLGKVLSYYTYDGYNLARYQWVYGVNSLNYAYTVPLPSKTSKVQSSGSKVVVSTAPGVSKNTGKVAGGKLTYLARTSNISSSTYADLLGVLGAVSSLGSVSEVDAAWEQLTAEPYASNLSVGLESMNRFRKNALAIALADNKISYTKTEKVKVCVDENGNAMTASAKDQEASKESASCKTAKVKKKLPWSLVIDGTNTQASLRGTEDLGSLDYNIFQSTYGVEYALSDQFSIGGVFGYGQNNLYNYEFADTRVNSDTYSGGLYGLYKPSEPATIALLGG